VETGQETPLAHKFPGFVNCLAFSPDGKVFASGHSDDCVRLFDLEGKLLRRLEGHRGGVRSVAFSPDGARLASGSADRTIKVWEVETGKELANLSGLENDVAAVAFSPDGKRLLYGLSIPVFRLKVAPHAFVWDLETNRRVAALVGHTQGVASVAWSPDGKTAATLGLDANVRLWDLAPLLDPKPAPPAEKP
jgi:WD40 repeat protein